MFVFANNQIVTVSRSAAERVAAETNGVVIREAADLASLDSKSLVTLHNRLLIEESVTASFERDGKELPEAVNRFSSKENGMTRVAKLIDRVEELPEPAPVVAATETQADAETAAPEAPTQAEPTKKAKKEKAPKVAKPRRGIDLKPTKSADEITECLQNTARSAILDALAQGWGATLKQVQEAQHAWAKRNGAKPWSLVSIRSGINFGVNADRGYGVKGEFHNGESAWRECNWDAADDLGWSSAEAGHPDEATEEKITELRERLIAEGKYDPSKQVQILRLVYPEGMSDLKPHRAKKGSDKGKGGEPAAE